MQNLWRDTSDESFSAPPLSGDRQADLCVIGGGFTGCSAALHAADTGARVVLVEADTIGHGGSGRNVGLVNAGLWSPPETIAQHLPQAQADRLIAMLAGAPQLVFDLIERNQIQCEARRAGTLHLAHSAAGLRDITERHRQLTATGAPVRLMDADETRARVGTGDFRGALFDPRAGTIQPLAYARGLARAAQAAGAEVFEGTPATAIRHDGAAWVVDTPGGRITAPALILATNAYHRELDGPAPGRVVPVNYFQAATKPVPGTPTDQILSRGEGCWDTGLIMTSIRRDAAGRVIIGAMGSLEAPGRALHLGWAHRRLARMFPGLGPVEFTHAWSGRIAMTGDHLPRIQPLGPGGFAAYGYSGRGIGPGTLFGRDLAHAALSGDTGGLPVDPSGPSRESMVPLRAAWIETGASLTHLVGART